MLVFVYEGSRQIFTINLREMLDNALSRSKIPDNSQMSDSVGQHLMNFIQPSIATQSHPQSEAMDQKCLHPRVQVVSRDEDAEFVECLECREIFESSEFRDMDIEAKIPTEEELKGLANGTNRTRECEGVPA